MDKNNIIINYYVDWRSTDWMKELFELNGFDSDSINEYIQVYEELMAREIVPNAIICPNIVNQEFNIIFFK